MKKKSKYIQPIIVIIFISIILTIGKQAHSRYYSCNDLTSSSFDLNLFNEDSTVNLFRDSRLAKRANRLCLKQLKKDQTNPQFIFQTAYTYLALREFDEAKKYLDLAIEQEYSAALLYSWIANDNEWINYEEEHEDYLKKAAESNYIAKYVFAEQTYNKISTNIWFDQSDKIKKEKKRIKNLLKEIEFFLPARNLLIVSDIPDSGLDYLKIKQLVDEIENNNKNILKIYGVHRSLFLKTIYGYLSIFLPNMGYADLGLKYANKHIEFLKVEHLEPYYPDLINDYKDNPNLAYAYQGLGWAYSNIGDITKGQENLMKSIAVAQKHPEVGYELLANTINLLGLTFIQTEEWEEAEKLLRESIKIYNENEARDMWLAYPIGNLGVVIYAKEVEFNEDGNPIIDTIPDEAKLYLHKYLSLLKELNESLSDQFGGISQLIEMYIYEENFKEAKKILNEVIKSGPADTRYQQYSIEFTKAQILGGEQNYEKAKNKLLQINSSIEKEELLSFSDYFYLKSSFINLLNSLKRDVNDKETSNIYTKELEIFTDKILKFVEDLDDFPQERIREIQAYSYYLIAYLQNKIENGEEFNEKAFKIMQLVSMTEVDFSSLSLQYRLTKQNSIDELKELQLLNYDLKILKDNFSTSNNKDIAASIAKIEEKKQSILTELGISKTNELKFYSYENFKKEIKPNETVLVFLSDSQNYNLVRVMFQNDKVSMVDLTSSGQEIKSYIQKILESTNLISWPPQDFATLEAHRLFKVLFKDIDPESIQKDNILIKSNGIISTLPFNILVKDYDKNPQNFETVSWLVDDNNIINIASFKYFFTNKEQKSIEKTFLGIGNPIFKKQEEEIKVAKINEENILNEIIMSRAAKQRNLILDPLPETAEEVRKISKFFPKTNNKLLLSKKASESVIKKANLEKYNYIIFATHAIPESETGDIKTSGLALSYPKEITNLDNGFLNSEEIMSMNLNSELVLLSACETATDNKDIGRAFSGLVNSFFFAGTNSVIASHWKIESNSTVQITTELFKNLIENKMQTAESLRKSILQFKKNNKELNHPAFWGAFSVTLNSRYN